MCMVIHIIPSGDQLCPDKPCVDLSQFAADSSKYTRTNTASGVARPLKMVGHKYGKRSLK